MGNTSTSLLLLLLVEDNTNNIVVKDTGPSYGPMPVVVGIVSGQTKPKLTKIEIESGVNKTKTKTANLRIATGRRSLFTEAEKSNEHIDY